jgi:hypothetical protein
MDKYDQAIEFLKDHAPGSYYEECAALMEELLALAHAEPPKLTKLSKEDQAWLKQAGGGARYYAKARGLL